MKLFTKADDKKLFAQYSKGSDLQSQKVIVKIFNPYGRGSWFIMNSDPNDPDYLWGIVDLGHGAEIGSISRSELETYKNKFGLGFERDSSFDPINAEELYQGLRGGKYYEEGGGVSFIDYKDSEIMYEPIYDKYYANDVEFDSLQEAKDFIDSGKVDSKIQDAYSKGMFSNGGSINQEYFIKNISFEDQTDISDNEYSFSFELFDKNGSSVNDYEGTITETSRGVELDWEVSGVLDEWWEQAEKIIIDAFTEYKFNNYAKGGNVIDAFQIRTVRGQGNAPTEILTTEQEVKFKKGGKLSESSNYVPTYEILKVHTKDGKVFENIYSETEVISGIYVSDKPLREKNPVGKNQIELFKKGGIPKTAIYIPRYNVDFIETENNGEIDGNYIYGGVWVDMKKQFRLVEEAKEKGTFNRKNKISKFEAIYNDKKISIEAENLLQAKTKAIAQLKVPKTKVGLLSVYSVKDPMASMYDNGGSLVNEPKEGDLITNYGKYGSRISKVTDNFVYWFDSRMDKYSCKKNDLILNNVDDDGDADVFYQDEPNNWICQKTYDNGGAISDSDKETLIYVNQILRRAVINGDLTVDEANSGLAFEIAKEEVEEFIDDDMDEMGSSDFGYMYRNFIESYKSVKGESFAKGGSIKDGEITKGKVFNLINGDVIEIVRLFKENIDEDWVEYKRNGEKKENSVKELRLFINRLKGTDKLTFDEWMKKNNIEVYKRTYYWVADDGGSDYIYSGTKAEVMKSLKEDWSKSSKLKSFRERRNEYLEKLGQKEADVWDEIGAESGSEIRNSDKMLKAYAEGVEKMLQKEGVAKGSFDEEDYEYFQDLNWHLFNEFLVWNRYYEPEMTKTEKAWREKNYSNPKLRSYVSNPKIISLSSGSKSKSDKYVPKAEIEEVRVKTDEGFEFTFKGSDVLNGVNILEKGSLLSNNATYVAKRNIMYVELKNGEKVKPANGYWIKKDAKGQLFKPEKKDWWQTVVNPNEDFNNYDNKKPIDWDVDDFKSWVVSNSDLDGNVDKEVLDVVKLPKSKLTVDYLNKNGSGKNDDEYYKKYGNWQSALYDVFTQMKNDYLKKNTKFEGGGRLQNNYFKNEIENDYIDKINNYYSEWFNIKDEKDSENFKNIKPPMFGTYQETDILDQIKNFEKLEIPFQANEVNRNQFKKEISKIIEKWMNMKLSHSKDSTIQGLEIGKKYRAKNGDVLTIKDFEIENHVTLDDGKGKLSSIGVQRISVFKELVKDGELVLLNETGGKTTFKQKATAIAKSFEGKKVEPKYQKEYGKTYDKAEAKEVGNKIAGSQKAKNETKMSKDGIPKKSGGLMLLAREIRKDGETWQSALKRAGEQLKK